MQKMSIFYINCALILCFCSLNAEIPLFEAFPQLSNIPYKRLGDWPTPVTCARKAAAQLGIKNLYIKRDDLSGVVEHGKRLPGCLRKLEFHFGQALAQGADTVLAIGKIGSNHTLSTALNASRLGLKSVLVLSNTHSFCLSEIRKNLLLSLYFGAEIHTWSCDDDFDRTIERKIYGIDEGGTNVAGELGIINAVFELKKQIDAGILPEPDMIYVPVGTAGFAIGLYVGAEIVGLKSKFIPVRVSNSRASGNFLELLHGINVFLEKHMMLTVSCIDEDFRKKLEASIDYSTIDSLLPFGLLMDFANDLLKNTEGITLDREYSGTAFAMLAADARRGLLKNKNVLFWNTTFNTDAFDGVLGGIYYKHLPKVFWGYFGYQESEQPYKKSRSSNDDLFYDGPGCG